MTVFQEKEPCAYHAGAAPGLTNLLVARGRRLTGFRGGDSYSTLRSTESDDPVSHGRGSFLSMRPYRSRALFAMDDSGLENVSENRENSFPCADREVNVVLAAQDEVATTPIT